MPRHALASRRLPRQQRGVSLLELIVAIVVIAVGVVGVLQGVRSALRTSADPMLQSQALAIAEAYMEEIMLQAYVDPDGSEANEARNATSCPSTGGSSSTYDDVMDYNGLNDTGARDQWGCAIADLASYNVAVSVQNSSLNTVPALKIDVTVTHAGDVDYTLTAYRINTP